MTKQNPKRYGVIDIGTLKVKCQVVEKDSSNNVVTVYQSNNLTCLGCRMLQNGNRPKKGNIVKMLSELKRCKKVFEKYKVVKSRVVSTHAFREMGEVGRELAGLIKEKVGFDVEIISQKEEADLFFKAVLNDFENGQEYVVIDVGGGSVQILIGSKGNLKQSFLLKTGSSTLWDMFTPKHSSMDFPKGDEITKMREYILSQLDAVPNDIGVPMIYGSSCIIDVFKAVSIPVQEHKSSNSHPFKAEIADIVRFLDGIWSVPYDEREKRFVSPTKGYMWGVDKAFLNVVELARKVKATYVIPSNANINQGLLMSIFD